jgi:hypothetical protein
VAKECEAIQPLPFQGVARCQCRHASIAQLIVLSPHNARPTDSKPMLHYTVAWSAVNVRNSYQDRKEALREIAQRSGERCSIGCVGDYRNRESLAHVHCRRLTAEAKTKDVHLTPVLLPVPHDSQRGRNSRIRSHRHRLAPGRSHKFGARRILNGFERILSTSA